MYNQIPRNQVQQQYGRVPDVTIEEYNKMRNELQILKE